MMTMVAGTCSNLTAELPHLAMVEVVHLAWPQSADFPTAAFEDSVVGLKKLSESFAGGWPALALVHSTVGCAWWAVEVASLASGAGARRAAAESSFERS